MGIFHNSLSKIRVFRNKNLQKMTIMYSLEVLNFNRTRRIICADTVSLAISKYVLNNHAIFAQSYMFDAIMICWSNFHKFDLILTSLIHLTSFNKSEYACLNLFEIRGRALCILFIKQLPLVNYTISEINLERLLQSAFIFIFQ